MIFYFLLICIGSFIAGRLILGELRKERRDYIAITPQNLESVSTVVPQQQPVISEQPVLLNQTDAQLQERINKVEALLAEKNVELTKLQNILEAERKHKAEFEKIKTLLQWQIFETRQMNKDVKRELDALTRQGKQFQDEASHLRSELTYKEQVLAQNETKISELKNRLHKFLSEDPSKLNDPHLKENSDPSNVSFDEFDWRTNLGD